MVLKFCKTATVWVLTAAILLSAMVVIGAESENKVWDGSVDTVFEGSGTAEDPYLIATAAQLAGLSVKVGTGTSYAGMYFKQTADIVLNDFSVYASNTVWTPIGGHKTTDTSSTKYFRYNANYPFSGTYDGDGHSVSGLYYSNSDSNYGTAVGLFGYLKNARITRLNLLSADIYANNDIGAIAGSCNASVIDHCSSYGTLSATVEDCGGIVGQTAMVSNTSAQIYCCYNRAAVTAASNVGGIAGHLSAGTSLSDCYNTGSISGNAQSGGIVGYIAYSGNTPTKLSNCFSSGAIVHTSGNGICYRVAKIGWEVSTSTVTNCYYLKENDNGINPGIVGMNGGDVTGQTAALSTLQMGVQESFPGFDFATVWEMGDMLPKLRGVGGQEGIIAHTHSIEWIIDKKPTFEAEGVRHSCCTVCHQTIAEEAIPTLVWINPFKDIYYGYWCYSSVRYVNYYGLFNGVEDDRFAPTDGMSRAMLVTVLYRLSGSPDVTGYIPFTDVDYNMWYSDAILWAKNEGYVNGTSQYSFSPSDGITRQDIAVILYRYAMDCGYDFSASGDLSGFFDSDVVSGYAGSAVSWAVDHELIKGNTLKMLQPKSEASRAEVAAILMRFCETFEIK